MIDIFDNYKPQHFRGDRYGQAKVELMPRLKARAEAVKREKGAFKILDVVTSAVLFNLPVKTTFEWLESAGVLPTATWEIKVANRNISVQKLIELAKVEYRQGAG
jgi:hypothetical protein